MLSGKKKKFIDKIDKIEKNDKAQDDAPKPRNRFEGIPKK